MRKDIIWLVFLLVLMASAMHVWTRTQDGTQPNQLGTDSLPSSDDYAVYSAVLAKYDKISKAITVDSLTWYSGRGRPARSIPPMKDLKQDTWDQFVFFNRKQYHLQRRFAASLPVAVANWDTSSANHKFPNGGLVELSRVGFSRDRSQAIVEYGYRATGFLGGFGELLLLERRNGKWTVVDKQSTWIS